AHVALHRLLDRGAVRRYRRRARSHQFRAGQCLGGWRRSVRSRAARRLYRRHRKLHRTGDRRDPRHLARGDAQRCDRRVATLFRSVVHRHGDVRAERHRRPADNACAAVAGPRLSIDAAAGAGLSGRLGAGAGAACRSHPPHRDDIPSQRQGNRGHDDLGFPRRARRRECEALGGRRSTHRRRVLVVPHDLAGRGRRLARRVRAGPWRGESEMTAPAVELIDVHKNFGATPIIRGVSLAVPPGERHAIIGPNGAGKSTLFNLVSGRLTPSAGTVQLNGEDVTGLPPHLINRRGLSRSFQVTNIFPRLSVWENIRCAVLWSLGHKYAFWRGIEGLPDVRARTEAILEAIDLIDRRRVQAGVLAYAEQRALEIGITIAGGAGIILLDEPSAGMSVAEAARAVALIRKVSEGRTLIMIEHDMGVVFDLADRISVLVYGQIIASDVPARIKQDSAVQTAYLGTAA